MKPKNFILITLLVAIVGLSAWWFLRPAVTTPEKIVKTESLVLSKVEAPKLAAPQTIAPPNAPPAPKPGSASIAATAPLTPKTDPQADLKTAVLDIARLIRNSGDPIAFRLTYTPPDKLDSQEIDNLMTGRQQWADQAAQNPFIQRVGQKLTENMASDYESLENQTPTYNDAGDEATYTWTHYYADGASTQHSSTFIKINGKWYLKQEEGY